MTTSTACSVSASGRTRGPIYEEFPEVPQKRRRFYHYRTVSWKLGLGPKERADLPGCVKDRIEEDYGDSEVGFRARFPR